MGVKGGGRGRDKDGAGRCGTKGLGEKKNKERGGSQEEKIKDQEGKGELRMKREKQERSKRREVKTEGVR